MARALARAESLLEHWAELQDNCDEAATDPNQNYELVRFRRRNAMDVWEGYIEERDNCVKLEKSINLKAKFVSRLVEIHG